jgi:hypothetical protein
VRQRDRWGECFMAGLYHPVKFPMPHPLSLLLAAVHETGGLIRLRSGNPLKWSHCKVLDALLAEPNVSKPTS